MNSFSYIESNQSATHREDSFPTKMPVRQISKNQRKHWMFPDDYIYRKFIENLVHQTFLKMIRQTIVFHNRFAL